MKFIIFFAGLYPVRFHTNTCGAMYSCVALAEATRFDSQLEAARKAGAHGLRPREYSIESEDAGEMPEVRKEAA